MERQEEFDIAVTGIAARFPGPQNLEDWRLAVLKGQVLTTRLSRDEAIARGVSRRWLSEDWVPVLGDLPDADRFDHSFFDISPREAELIDPQHRLALETAWQALEDAGVDPGLDERRSAVFASSTGSTYMRAMLGAVDADPGLIDDLVHGCEPDFLASRVSYKLGLRGPAMAVQTACSSSLVGVHLAAQALAAGDCDQAVVIGTSVAFPSGGYMYQPGGVLSPSGNCRPFSSDSDGVVGGFGVAAVVLRRREDAENDGIQPYGHILGTAVNNDGAGKAGYYAPSLKGQSEVISSALLAANVEASSIGYLMTHGTATPLGDPIEWTAASNAYRSLGAGKESITVGAIKANVGHLDACAGLVSLVSTLQVINSGEVPPVASFSEPNKNLDTENSPLRIPKQAETWSGPELRRAGISSFGIGGTNAHVVVEQAHPLPSKASSQNAVVAPVSAKDSATLNRLVQNIYGSKAWAEESLDTIGRTLAGRSSMRERQAVIVHEGRQPDAKRQDVYRGQEVPPEGRPTALVFPGQGTQLPGLALPYCSALPGFRDDIAEFVELIHEDSASLASDVRASLLDSTSDPDALNQTRLAQPTIVCVQLAITRALTRLGVVPSAAIGHSLGEITAAYAAGVIGERDVLRFAISRGEAMQSCPSGVMLALGCSESEARRLIANSSVDLASINGPEMVVVSGPHAAVRALADGLPKEVFQHELRTSHAFHSSLITPALDQLLESYNDLTLSPARIPLGSASEGRILDRGEIPGTSFWVDSANAPVQFAKTAQVLATSVPETIALEVGPGSPLAGALQHLFKHSASMGSSHSSGVLGALGAAWSFGSSIELSRLLRPGPRCHLPTYPFKGNIVMPSELQQSDDLRNERSLPVGDADSPSEIDPLIAVRSAWERVLGETNFEPNDNFFSMGGDSLMAVRLVRNLNQTYEVSLPVAQFMLAKTLATQAEVLKQTLELKVEPN